MIDQNTLIIGHDALIGAGLDTTFVAQFALFLGVLLLSTLFFGKIFRHFFNIPTIAGQILGGIILGPSLINIGKLPFFARSLHILDQATGTVFAIISSDLFIFFVLLLSSALTVAYLLWIAGHETDIKDIFKVGLTASLAGVLGAFVPIILTAIIAFYGLGGTYTLARSIGIGIVFAATSVSIPVAMLVAQRKMHLRTSKATLGAAIIDDIVAVVILSIFMMLLNAGVFGDMPCLLGDCFIYHGTIASSLLSMAAAFGIIGGIGYFLVPPVIVWLQKKNLTHLMAPVATGIMLIYFAFVELFGGLAGITGAYFAGLFHKRADHHHYATKVLEPFINAILLPLFLSSIGLMVDLSILNISQWAIIILLLVIAVISKMVACFGATWLSNLFGWRVQAWSPLEGYLFGASMVARGEVGLVVATILNGTKLITPEQYVICVVVIVLTTIVSPIMLALGFRQFERLLLYQGASGEYERNIGLFPAIGANQMFNVIIGQLEEHHFFNTAIHVEEGRRIINLEGHNVKILLAPGEGIIFKGDKRKIEEILYGVREAILREIYSIQLHK